MLRGTRSSHSSFSPRSGTTSRRSKCLGVISPRTATLLLALLGVIAHLQTFRNLAVLHDSFPHVPKARGGGGNGGGGIKAMDVATTSTAFVATTSSSDVYEHPVPLPTSTQATTEDALALIRPTKWFNLLPKRPWSGAAEDQRTSSTPEEMAIWRAQQAGQDEERRSWETARRLTTIMRVYAFLSALACMLGLYGVVRSSLGATRIFVISSFLDVFLFALSLVSFCIIITYPGVRAMLCEQISSGELHSFLSYMHGANHDAAKAADATTQLAPTSSPIVQLTSSAAALVIGSSGGQMTVVERRTSSAAAAAALEPAARFISYATGPLWKRALAATSTESSSLTHIYWWDTLLDDMLENESCDDIFISVLVPMGLIVCLTYLALRIHFLFVIRTYYTDALRNHAGYYLCQPSSSGNSSCSEGNTKIKHGGAKTLHTIDEKPARKYSSSSSSSSTVIEIANVGRSKLAEKIYTDKMA